MALLIAGACAGLLSSDAKAQLRVATYNIEADIDGFTTPRPGLETVLEGIGAESVNGVARPLDILTLQETTSNATTVQPIVNSLNATYGPGTYAMSPYQGTQNGTFTGGNGPNALVYNTQTLQLIASVGVGIPSSSGEPRQEIRYQFRPVGYGSNSDFYVYVGHYKSASDQTSENRRLAEAQLVRTDAATLPAGSRVLYTGDFNFFKNSSEPSWSMLTATGSGTLANNRGIDPINLGNGVWDDQNSAFDFAYSESTTNLRYRDDMQFQTPPTNDGHGFSYISGSHHVFGNNGTTPINGSATNASNTALQGMPNRSAILSALTTASDHYPVVADYRLPAKMSMSVSSVPATVIVGAPVPVNVTITNSAPTTLSFGADGLDYSVSGSGSLSGSGAGTNLLVTSSGNVHALALNTSAVGSRSGTVTATSSSQDVGNGTLTQNVSTNVIDHAHPSISVGSIDFGIRGRGLGVATTSFFIANTLGAGSTAGLDLDSIGASGSTAALTTTATTFTNLAAGAGTSSRKTYVASLSDADNGTFSATYTFNLSDQDLPGATGLGALSLTLTGIVATPGDANLDGVITFDDYVRIDLGFNNHSTGWANGDFNGDGVVNFDDYVLIDINFNQQLGTLSRAVDWISGDDRSVAGLDSSGMSEMLAHLDQFGSTYGAAFLAAVPEPALGFGATVIALALAGRRTRIRR